MHLKYRNVNEAFRELVRLFNEDRSGIIKTSTSRVGDVLYIQEPVTITYTHLREKVLFNQARDANPFFHVYEALWMLAGRNDIAGPAYYAANYRDCVQDGDSPVANGAYGYRWRWGHNEDWGQYGPVDQLKLIVDQLKVKPDSRRCVLQMWNVEDDLLKIDSSKDVCCNTHVYFALREVPEHVGNAERQGNLGADPPRALDMTVCNRSNDLIWGLLGANAVHFSFLQEYMAACIGCEVGVYNQVTNNCHVYLNDKWKPEKWLTDDTPDWYLTNDGPIPPLPGVRMFPLVKDPATFDRELPIFVEHFSKSRGGISGNDPCYEEPFLATVAQFMCLAFDCHKHRCYDMALKCAEMIEADDWRIAATNWLLKRKANYEASQLKS